MKPAFPFNLLLYKNIAAITRAVNNGLRQKMLHTIHRKGSLTVSELKAAMKMSQSTTSSHLKILREAGIVLENREGRSVHYSINHKRVSEMQKLFEKLLE